MARVVQRRSPMVPILLGGLALGAVVAVVLVVISLRDDPAKPKVVARPAPAETGPGAAAGTRAPDATGTKTGPLAVQPEVHQPVDPSIHDPNGNYRVLYQEEHPPTPPETWDKVTRILGRPLSDNERLRVDRLVGGWKDDMDQFDRAREEGRYDELEYKKRSGSLGRAMTSRFRDMLHADKAQSTQLIGIFGDQMGITVAPPPSPTPGP